MKFSEAFKVFQLNILKQAGIPVTPDQLGLKSDPIADLQAKSAGRDFSSILSKVSGNGAGIAGQAPTPPTPPTDPLDPAQQTKYHQELLAYQQALQAYNQRFMQMLLQQFNALQQNMQASQRQSTPSNTDTSLLGIGGILGGSSDT